MHELTENRTVVGDVLLGTTRAAAEAPMGPLVIWICVAAAVATLFIVTRAVCDRIRFTGWQHDLDSLVGHGDGHTTNQL